MRPLALLALPAALLPHAASADWMAIPPAWADVIGVASGDTLNMRAEPSPGAAVVRRLPPDAEMEVERCLRHPNDPALSGPNWCRVTYEGVTGWVNARFLDVYGDI